jgi:2-amino-4-hydroxy-6-hydroxymethyldihydropteridine diphosphokinase
MARKLHKAIILLGSNIDTEKNIKKAKDLLTKISKDYRFSDSMLTKPLGYKNQQDFTNAVASVHTELEQEDLQALLKSFENILGRQRDPKNKNGPRTIDLDIIFFDGEIVGDDFQKKPFIKNLVSQLGVYITL